jgi:hypothetical protein
MDPLPFAPYHLAPGSQTVWYLPWLKVSLESPGGSAISRALVARFTE